MSARSNLLKATLGLGAISTTLLLNAAPAFSQTSPLDLVLERAELEQAEASTTANAATAEQTPLEPVANKPAVTPEKSGAAMLMLTEALAADGITDLFISAESEALSPAPEKPGAEALSGLESASIDNFSIGSNSRNLSAAGASITVDPSSVPALTAALTSEEALTQLYAADALWTLTGDRDLILPTLIEAANSEDPDIQELAVLALRQMGDEASPAVPVLIELLDKDSRTRLIAQDAIAVINSENRSEAVLGIIARESQRRLLPAALRAITGLWR